jgi:hypothetical protein
LKTAGTLAQSGQHNVLLGWILAAPCSALSLGLRLCDRIRAHRVRIGASVIPCFGTETPAVGHEPRWWDTLWIPSKLRMQCSRVAWPAKYADACSTRGIAVKSIICAGFSVPNRGCDVSGHSKGSGYWALLSAFLLEFLGSSTNDLREGSSLSAPACS